MLSVTRFVGLDYHQDSVQVCVMDQDGRTWANRSVEIRWQAVVAALEETVGDGSGLRTVTPSVESCSGAAHLSEERIGLAGGSRWRARRDGWQCDAKRSMPSSSPI